jgi:L,D-transpeptidase ErfK/SrfK
MRGHAWVWRIAVVVLFGVASACGAPVAPPPRPPAVAASAPPTEPLTPIEKVTRVTARIPRDDELPGLVGRLQRHRVLENETLLMIGRAAGVGFRALRAANPILQKYVPRPGTEIVVPTRFVLPPSGYRGLVVNVAEMRLYMFPAETRPGERVEILTWPVGIGAEVAQSPVGRFRITSKDANPTWVVPDSIYGEMEDPRRVVPPGPDNPLGAYRIRTSMDLYAFHGTNDPWTVGRPTTHGCIRLYPEDIERLYIEVPPGFPGEFVYEPVKLGRSDGRVYVEVHPDVYGRIADLEAHAIEKVERAGLGHEVDRARLRAAVTALRGVPEDVSVRPAG